MITQTQFPFQALDVANTNGINAFALIAIVLIVVLIVAGICFVMKESNEKKTGNLLY